MNLTHILVIDTLLGDINVIDLALSPPPAAWLAHVLEFVRGGRSYTLHITDGEVPVEPKLEPDAIAQWASESRGSLEEATRARVLLPPAVVFID